LDKIARLLPAANPLISTLRSLTWLEAYATAFRYPTPSGRVPAAPQMSRVKAALDGIETLLVRLSEHFGVDLSKEDGTAAITSPVR
jgi:hypothetical protein